LGRVSDLMPSAPVSASDEAQPICSQCGGNLHAAATADAGRWERCGVCSRNLCATCAALHRREIIHQRHRQQVVPICNRHGSGTVECEVCLQDTPFADYAQCCLSDTDLCRSCIDWVWQSDRGYWLPCCPNCSDGWSLSSASLAESSNSGSYRTVNGEGVSTDTEEDYVAAQVYYASSNDTLFFTGTALPVDEYNPFLSADEQIEAQWTHGSHPPSASSDDLYPPGLLAENVRCQGACECLNSIGERCGRLCVHAAGHPRDHSTRGAHHRCLGHWQGGRNDEEEQQASRRHNEEIQGLYP
jgi:hypothetical protein